MSKTTKKPAIRVKRTSSKVRVAPKVKAPTIPDNLKQQVAKWNHDVKILKNRAEKLRTKNPNTPEFKKELAALQKEKDRLEKAKAHIAMLAGRRGLVVNNKK